MILSTTNSFLPHVKATFQENLVAILKVYLDTLYTERKINQFYVSSTALRKMLDGLI